MTLREDYQRNPFNWKDALAVGAFAATIGTMVWQGGRLAEKQEAIVAQLTAMSSQMQAMQSVQTAYSTELARLRGRDELHDEKLRRLDEDMTALKAREAREHRR